MSTWRILLGDVRDTLARLPDASVQCCVTSPPYWGLRDYGTAKWDGGDPACDHLAPLGGGTAATGLQRDGRSEEARQRTAESVVGDRRQQYRSLCGKCGASRTDKQIGLEPTPKSYEAALVDVFREVRRVMRDDATLWINLGDSFHGKNLVGIPWRVAFALQRDGWYLRSDIIWSKPNPMPESVTDRPTKAHEYLFLLTKSARYYYDSNAIREAHQFGDTQRGVRRTDSPQAKHGGANHMEPHADGRNKRSVWHVATQPFSGAHFATFPEALIEPCILAGTSEKGQCPACGAPWVRVVERGFVGQSNPYGPSQRVQGNRTALNGRAMARRNATREHKTHWQPSCACAAGDPIPQTVLDPFTGSGTTGAVAIRHQRSFIGCELNADYMALARTRIGGVAPLLATEVA
jgi:DNA modification methylase